MKSTLFLQRPDELSFLFVLPSGSPVKRTSHLWRHSATLPSPPSFGGRSRIIIQLTVGQALN